MTKAQAEAQDVVDHYRLQGWRGQALEQRIRKHARILNACDPDVAKELRGRAQRAGSAR